MPLLIWEVATAYLGGCHCLSGRLPLLIWWVGGKMNLRIRLTSAKVGVGVEVEAELGNYKNAILSKNVKTTPFLTDFHEDRNKWIGQSDKPFNSSSKLAGIRAIR